MQITFGRHINCLSAPCQSTRHSSCFLCRGEHGRLWASALFGKPSFVQIPNAYEAVIAPLMQCNGDPAQYTAGSSVATVGVMFENRRRNLISGIVASNNGGKLRLNEYQAFENCPKYIQGMADILMTACIAAHACAGPQSMLS